MSVLAEKSPPGWEATVKAMKKHKEITNPWALAWWMKKQGYTPRKKPRKKPRARRKRESLDIEEWSFEEAVNELLGEQVGTMSFRSTKGLYRACLTLVNTGGDSWEKLYSGVRAVRDWADGIDSVIEMAEEMGREDVARMLSSFRKEVFLVLEDLEGGEGFLREKIEELYRGFAKLR